ncbi:DUF262 domain-containing protein [Sphingorhabdus lacus]|uniref:DUF262 domain-containing protein n=1 Tax=Sphingorhabdus lacus TaxID=392610 RepID=A0A6I6L8Y8_9SPHN|nr:DUF262 domain-containing protein [Sphingorhabdus lacus]QGY80801.1 DUF262 domain-containing protein [Sphingorhabdus lacus]
MKSFHIHEMPDSSVLALNDIRESVELSPDYQRPGGVWSLKNKQLFIDSLLNGYDIPKLYFHYLTGVHARAGKDYAIIDGRQRLETIWEFIDGSFALSTDFKFYENEEYNAAGMTFSDIEKEYPRLLIKLHARSLSVMVVTADDLDFIEDMFSRLNEAVPLNAAEKRNAFGGALPNIIRNLAGHRFLTDKVAFPPTRYRHYDVAAKLLIEEYYPTVVDTKKARLDDFVKSNRLRPESAFSQVVERTKATLEDMTAVFANNDPLLKSSGMVVVYYVLFSKHPQTNLTRQKLLNFERAREANRDAFASEDTSINFDWIEYDELARSSNDAASIRSRVDTLITYLSSEESIA